MKATTPEEFDEVITRRLNGYDSVEEMYNDIGCDKYIKDITIPVLMFASRRDPICVLEAAPIEVIASKSNMVMAFTKAGSHAEWFTGIFPERVNQ
jgi:predicted alpha/beta-fold hydrolase